MAKFIQVNDSTDMNIINWQGVHSAARFTVITSNNPSILTKKVELVDDKIVKTPTAQLIHGRAEVKTFNNLSDFKAVLVSLKSHQALTYGIPINGVTDATVVTSSSYNKLADKTGYISRTNEHFGWPCGPAIMMLDYDPQDGAGALSKDYLIDLLRSNVPGVKAVDLLWWGSSSSLIYNKDTDEQLSGVSGQRIYIMVADGTDIPRAAKVIEQRLWLAGHGYIKITTAGTMLERVPFDMTVYQPSRLDFAAGAHCVAPLEQRRGEPDFIKGMQPLLDTRVALPDLSDAELHRVSDLMTNGKLLARSKADAIRKDYIENKLADAQAFDPKIDIEVVRAEIEKALDGADLPGYWPIVVRMYGEMQPTTVNDILSNKVKYHGAVCLDPIEPDYDGGRTVGKIYSNQQYPSIHSFARGERTFKLVNKRFTVTYAPNQLDVGVEHTLVILSKGSEIFCHGNDMVMLNNTSMVPVNEHLLQHFLGLNFNYEVNGKPINPSKNLVKNIIEVGKLNRLKHLKAITDHPLIRGDLKPMLKPGYDSSTEIMGVFNMDDFPDFERNIDAQRALHHLKVIFEPFREFPFESNADLTVAITAIFSVVLRPILKTCPAFGFDAPLQGSGKTLLATALSVIGTGEIVSAMAPLDSRKEDEVRKRLLSLLIADQQIAIFDNMVGVFDSPSMASVITQEGYSDRELGISHMQDTINNCVFIFTGNNLQMNGDMSRRVLMCRINPQSEQPINRTFDFDPIELARETRPKIIMSVLALVQYWIDAGAPEEKGRAASFSSWDKLVRQPIAFLARTLPESKLVDPMTVMLKNAQANPELDDLFELLYNLAKLYPNQERFKAGELHNNIRHARNGMAGETETNVYETLTGLAGQHAAQSARSIGNQLSYRVDRITKGLVLRSTNVSGSKSYWVEVLDANLATQIASALARVKPGLTISPVAMGFDAGSSEGGVTLPH
ncbi:hypothetical protein [Thiosulfativibrio zosterae]|uniref:Uncharacterized protein n=1 Tax=Thiosulfativibrio zosterae TaxID=2675053 RepID=A0A6F8PN41_9GAMM|nr:hypothetical protein [Thiosulfativibrio zosterae]BBP43532.1 hypothetical protein THMIRHAT_12780 [Thiosulfativibrio zosterae]